MFKKQKINPNMTDTLIGEGTSFEGSLKSKAGVRIEGQFQGEIDCEGDIMVGKSGIVTANIKARSVNVSGTLTGNVEVEGTLTIHSSGSLYGDIACGSIAIEEGGVFSGRSSMTGKGAPENGKIADSGTPGKKASSEKPASRDSSKEQAAG